MSGPACRHPHDVANLRLYLLDKWRPAGAYEQASTDRWTLDPSEFLPGREGIWQRGHLTNAGLWWISSAMVDEITHVAGELPADTAPEDVPGLVPGDNLIRPSLVVLEKTLLGVDARSATNTVNVDALLIGGTRWKSGRIAVGLSTYRRANWDEGLPASEISRAYAVVAAMEAGQRSHYIEHQTGAGNFAVELHGYDWIPLGRSDWPLGTRLDYRVSGMNDEAHASNVEDRRWIAAFHLVVDDYRVATVTHERPATKPQRRPSERKGLDPKVRVVYLRQLPHETAADAPADTTKRKAPKAHIVRSHPRWQAWGPDRAERKLIIVPRHARGHGGTPKEGPPTIKAVVR